ADRLAYDVHAHNEDGARVKFVFVGAVARFVWPERARAVGRNALAAVFDGGLYVDARVVEQVGGGVALYEDPRDRFGFRSEGHHPNLVETERIPSSDYRRFDFMSFFVGGAQFPLEPFLLALPDPGPREVEHDQP